MAKHSISNGAKVNRLLIKSAQQGRSFLTNHQNQETRRQVINIFST